jgi:hypothetical protein
MEILSGDGYAAGNILEFFLLKHSDTSVTILI